MLSISTAVIGSLIFTFLLTAGSVITAHIQKKNRTWQPIFDVLRRVKALQGLSLNTLARRLLIDPPKVIKRKSPWRNTAFFFILAMTTAGIGLILLSYRVDVVSVALPSLPKGSYVLTLPYEFSLRFTAAQGLSWTFLLLQVFPAAAMGYVLSLGYSLSTGLGNIGAAFTVVTLILGSSMDIFLMTAGEAPALIGGTAGMLVLSFGTGYLLVQAHGFFSRLFRWTAAVALFPFAAAADSFVLIALILVALSVLPSLGLLSSLRLVGWPYRKWQYKAATVAPAPLREEAPTVSGIPKQKKSSAPVEQADAEDTEGSGLGAPQMTDEESMDIGGLTYEENLTEHAGAVPNDPNYDEAGETQKIARQTSFADPGDATGVFPIKSKGGGS